MKYLVKINITEPDIWRYQSTDWENLDVEIFNNGFWVHPSVHGPSYAGSYIDQNEIQFQSQNDKEYLLKLFLIRDIII